MEDFTMSMYVNEKELYKAKAKYYEEKLKYIAELHWFQEEAAFRFGLPEVGTVNKFLSGVCSHIDEKLKVGLDESN